ncbi:formate transporter FocA [Luteococcus sp. H138]|uniref:formate transporter FocA n=1 Tax=unclassified Luteococcus TaxID=2639923 RepID=UPI00313CF10B
MTDFAIDGSTAKVNAPAAKTFMLALTGGTFIGIGMLFFLTSQIGAAAMPLGMAKVVGGLVFTVGLALVVLTGAELFTGSTLALGARTVGRVSWGQVLRNWAIVYVGNFFGALTLAGLIWLGGSWESGKGALGLGALKAADAKCSHTIVEAIALGILCNLLVCLAVWLTYAGRTATDKIIALTLPIAMFVACGFEHSVANMFLLPFAMMLKTWAPASFWAETATSADAFSHLSWTGIFTSNILPVTVGNIIGGGIMIGVFYTIVHKKIGAAKP